MHNFRAIQIYGMAFDLCSVIGLQLCIFASNRESVGWEEASVEFLAAEQGLTFGVEFVFYNWTTYQEM